MPGGSFPVLQPGIVTPVAGAAVLQGHPAVPPGGNSKGKAAEGASQQAGAKGKNKVLEQSSKKAAAGMSF